MEISELSVLSQNITIVYDSLDLKGIDTSRIKAMTQGTPTIMDTPEMIVAIYPQVPFVIQIGDRRVRVTIQRTVDNLASIGRAGGTTLWNLALQCHKLIKDGNISAYGFNLDVSASVSDPNSREKLLEIFVSDSSRVNVSLGATLEAITPRLRFTKGSTRYDLIIEALERSQFKSHLNAHFRTDRFPSQSRLENSFREELDYFISTLNALFGEG